MVEFIKKGALIGLGLAFMTKEKAEAAAKKLVKEADLKKDEGKKLVEDLLKKSDEAKKAVEKIVDTAVTTAITKLNIPTRTEMKKLEERIRELEARQ
jgi:polyhydroxyalkanoate synthesis regulator phasin